ncbi:MAG TPA: hypothetical protein VGE74_26570 [Gemmata sp.]
MHEQPPLPEIVRAGYETRDVWGSLVVTALGLIVLLVAGLLIALGQVSALTVPEQDAPGAAPPATMPGEVPVHDRAGAVAPRLEHLSPPQRPEDLRADRQPALNRYEWEEPGKVARIPIGAAMDAVVERQRTPGANKGGTK